ncbi:MAG TPA: hypothetical protein VFO35_07380, partial [Steroidobacteraceae bacterium]|nr:hypothetical protein [Steroidobacteraceae bacterium]
MTLLLLMDWQYPYALATVRFAQQRSGERLAFAQHVNSVGQALWQPQHVSAAQVEELRQIE